MAGFNKVILLGNLTRDPQLKYLPNNTAVCEIGLAVNRNWRDRDGNTQEEVCFVDLAAYGRQAEVINQYMAKGRPLMIEGRLKYDQWTAQDGSKRSKLRVVIENFQFVGGRDGGRDGGGSEESGGQGRSAPRTGQRPPPADTGGQDHYQPTGDDIPF